MELTPGAPTGMTVGTEVYPTPTSLDRHSRQRGKSAWRYPPHEVAGGLGASDRVAGEEALWDGLSLAHIGYRGAVG